MELFICGKVMELKGLASTLKFGSFSSYVFISYIEVLSHIYEVEEHDLTMLYELRNGWKRIVNYKEIFSWGKLIVPLAFWNQLANVIELPSFQNDFTCRWVFGKTLYDLVQSYLGRPSTFFVFDEVIMEYMLCSSYKFSVLYGILFSNHVGMVFYRISVVFEVCIKTSIIIFTLEDKGGFKGTGEDGASMEIIWPTLTNVIVIATISSTLVSDICGACVRYLFGAFDLGMDQMSPENERVPCKWVSSYWGYRPLLVEKEKGSIPGAYWVFHLGGLIDVIVWVFDPGGSNHLLGVMIVNFNTVYKDTTRRSMIVLTLEDKGVLKE
ncbi:hypothetical protein RND81_07G197200 [Saponaria officinalis]|uniref:Uncharacterized protein n=1 Tax=Saponaria officinalis TaxID=3572 RepID=A0AAW1JSE6_SAPOF